MTQMQIDKNLKIFLENHYTNLTYIKYSMNLLLEHFYDYDESNHIEWECLLKLIKEYIYKTTNSYYEFGIEHKFLE